MHCYGNYDWLMLNGSIEFAASYLIMPLVLFFYSAGRIVSMDNWLQKIVKRT